MNKKALKLDKYGISNKRYKELCGFCEQYPEWKEAIKDTSFIRGVDYSDMPHSPNTGTSNPTQQMAVRLENIDRKCHLIEEVAKEADAEFWTQIIKSVCYGVSVEYMSQFDGLHISKSAFYDRRRYFFYLLDQKKG